jgi:hypothetical protein
MKKLIIFIILSLGLTINAQSQIIDTCFSKRKIINIYNNIRVLEHRDSIHTQLMEEYKAQCIDFKSALELDSITIEGQKVQITNLQENVKDWKKIYDTVKPKWYEKPPIMFTSGAILTMFLFKVF